MRTAQDFISLTAAIQMDLRAAQAKMVELRAWIAALDLPTDEQPYNRDRGEAYVRTVGWMYEPASLEADLRDRGADEETVSQLLELADQRRQEVSA